MFLYDDGVKGRVVQTGKQIDDFLENGEGLILQRYGVHVGSGDLLAPLLLRNIDKRILYHIVI